MEKAKTWAFFGKHSCRVFRRLGFVLLITISCVTASRAVTAAGRAGGGLAAAGGGAGWAALVGFELHGRTFFVRGEGRAVDVTGKAEMGFAGVGLGVAPARALGAMRPYLLATMARGVDIREADWATSAGLAAGLDYDPALPGLFMEARYDRLFQDHTSTRHYDLPRDQGTLLIGLRVGQGRP